MNHFHRGPDGALWAEDVPLEQVAAEVGTPTYVYSRATIERHYRAFDAAWASVPHLVCFAVKACSNLAVLNLLARLGAGFDIVSLGELERVLRAGGSPDRVVFSGVGKTVPELERALAVGVRCVNVESPAELAMLDEVARRLGVRAPVSLRVNPDVDPKTHPYIATGLKRNKFGIPYDAALPTYEDAMGRAGIEVVGLDFHIGSQLAETGPFVEATERMVSLLDELHARGVPIRHLDVGGGLGITYRAEAPPEPAEYAAAVLERIGDRAVEIVTEPGRVIVGNAGVLLTRCVLTKDNGETRFVVVDAGMNDAIRPALYSAWHDLEPVAPPRAASAVVDVVGPVCESGDFFARDRELPELAAGELVAMRSAGAYGFVMSSNYNSRPRAAEVLVDGDRYHVVRARETVEDLMRGETLPDLDAPPSA
ncbi:MAG: diaminopimelate decarboxylase [Deltaproteobacteria bacterium]|nr:diaminopimelate decarboxylase [Deltaproteobacteria bacterium]